MEKGELPPQAALDAAKGQFRQTMFDNDAFFAVAAAKLADVDNGALPDFGCEPTYQQNEDGTYKLGVRFSASRTIDGGILTSGFAAYSYLSLADVDTQTGATKVSDEFAAALTAAGHEPSGETPLGVLNAWQTGFNHVVRSTKGETCIDPIGSVVALKSEVENRQILNETLPETADEPFEHIAETHDWLFNLPTDSEHPDASERVATLDRLQAEFGIGTVLVTQAARNPETGELAKIRGWLGVHIEKDALDDERLRYYRS